MNPPEFVIGLSVRVFCLLNPAIIPSNSFILTYYLLYRKEKGTHKNAYLFDSFCYCIDCHLIPSFRTSCTSSFAHTYSTHTSGKSSNLQTHVDCIVEGLRMEWGGQKLWGKQGSDQGVLVSYKLLQAPTMVIL